VKHVVEGVVINTRAAQTVVCGSDNGNAHLSIDITTHDDRIGLLPDYLSAKREDIPGAYISREQDNSLCLCLLVCSRIITFL
jgi:hypothetical protein